MSRIYNNHGRAIYEPSTDEDVEKSRLILERNPSYWVGSVKRLSAKIECDVSKNTLYKIIDLFNKNHILHSSSAGKFTDTDGNVRNVGTVFVQDSPFWQIELGAAVKMAKENAKRLYGEQKGEDHD